ncbi:hypothetical protein ACFQ1S_05690 [Kibdelosporangium lantanae]|uniref:Uncharacterized protein n=1 Tax=Kibdelosporangium lantanae TaxID=1497396 RepID=A0ABW3M6A3_9PSEU
MNSTRAPNLSTTPTQAWPSPPTRPVGSKVGAEPNLYRRSGGQRMSSGSDPRLRWITGLVGELSEFLEEPVALVGPIEECLVGDNAFSCPIRSSHPRGRVFQLCWNGVLGMAPFDGKPHVSATLFLYSRNQRLALPGHPNGSILEVVYESGQWTTPHWQQDEFGEYIAYDAYGN